jgi:hypothetical protein
VLFHLLYLIIQKKERAMNLSQKNLPVAVWANRSANHPAFKEGYDSVMKSKPYDYNIENANWAVCYARGRMFAIWCKQHSAPRAVWRDGVPAKTLVERVIHAASYKIFV